jgi:Holliday junction resolvasome RuvABC endonuclease subunit
VRLAVGIDPSLAHTGVCWLVDGVEHAVCELPTPFGLHRPERLILARENLRKFLQTDIVAQNRGAPVIIALETEIWMGSGHTASESASIQTVYQMLLWELRTQWAKAQWPTVWYVPVNVSQVKKWVDAAEKQHILMKVYKVYGREFTNDNMADAFVLAQVAEAYGRARAEPGWAETLPKRQQEVLKKLSLPWESELKPKVKKIRRRGL